MIGTTGDVLSDALRQRFPRLNLPFEESTQAFRLPTLNNELLTEATDALMECSFSDTKVWRS